MDPINFANFNQDFSCVSIGTPTGYKIYNCEPFGQCFKQNDGAMGIVEMLFCTSLVAVVGVGEQPNLSPRRLKILNTKRGSTICELTFPTAVLKVSLNRKRLVVTLEEQMYIYEISNMKLLHTIETAPNPGAVMALSSDGDNSWMVYPAATPGGAAAGGNSSASINSASTAAASGPSRSGDVTVFNTLTLEPVNVIEAHRTSIACLAISSDGSLLATASDKGTVIRIFALPSATKLYQFRRGTYPAKIFSINFSLNSQLLAVSSATETVHIYKLGGLPTLAETERKSGGYSNLLRFGGKNVVDRVGGYLPQAVTEMWEPTRDFAYVKLPVAAKTRSVVAVTSTTGPTYAVIVTSEGVFYQYAIDMDYGGECPLVRQFSLVD